MLRRQHIPSGSGGSTHVQSTKPVITEGAGEKSKRRRVMMRDQEDLTAADPDLVFTASKFVKNILEKAKIEAAKRIKAQNLVSRGIRFQQELMFYISNVKQSSSFNVKDFRTLNVVSRGFSMYVQSTMRWEVGN